MKFNMTVSVILLSILLVNVDSVVNVIHAPKFDDKASESPDSVGDLQLTLLHIYANFLGVANPFSSPPTGGLIERENRVIATSIVKLWTDLRLIKDSRRVLRRFVWQNKQESYNWYGTINLLDHEFAKDLNLGKRYEHLKEETKRTLQVPSFFVNLTAFYNLSKTEKYFYVTNEYGAGLSLIRFMYEINYNKNYEKIALACFELAEDKEIYSKIQNIFDVAIRRTKHLVYFGQKGEYGNVLFSDLKNMIMKDADLTSALKQKQIVLPEIPTLEFKSNV